LAEKRKGRGKRCRPDGFKKLSNLCLNECNEKRDDFSERCSSTKKILGTLRGRWEIRNQGGEELRAEKEEGNAVSVTVFWVFGKDKLRPHQ